MLPLSKEKRWLLFIVTLGVAFFLFLLIVSFPVSLSFVKISFIYLSFFFLPGVLLSELIGFSNAHFYSKVSSATACSFIFYYFISIVSYFFEWPHQVVLVYYVIGLLTLLFLVMVLKKNEVSIRWCFEIFSDSLFYILTSFAAVIIFILARYYYTGADTWAHFAAIRHLVGSDRITTFGAIFGESAVQHAYAYNLIYFLYAEIIRLSKIDLVYVWQILSAFMTIATFCSVYTVSEFLFSDKRKAYISTILFIALYFGYYVFYVWGLPYFIFIAQPNTITQLLIFPLTVMATIQYIKNPKNHGFFFASLLIPVLLVSHVQFFLYYLLNFITFLLIELFYSASRKMVFQKAFRLLGTGFLLSLPIIVMKYSVLLTNATPFISDNVHDILPVYRSDWIVRNGKLFIANPLLLTSFCLFGLGCSIVYYLKHRFSIEGKWFLASSLFPLVILYTPGMGAFLAKFVSPYIVIRLLADDIRMYAVYYFVAVFLIFVFEKVQIFKRRLSLNVFLGILLFTFSLFFLPLLSEKINVFHGKKLDTVALLQDKMHQYLNRLPAESVILANKIMSYHLPAFTRVSVVHTTTNAAIVDGMERSRLFIDLISGMSSINSDVIARLIKYDVEYILLNEESPFEKIGAQKLLACPTFFSKTYEVAPRVLFRFARNTQHNLCLSHGEYHLKELVTSPRFSMDVSLDVAFDAPTDSDISVLFDDRDDTLLKWQHGQSFRLNFHFDRIMKVNEITISRYHPNNFAYLSEIRAYQVFSNGENNLISSNIEPYVQHKGAYLSKLAVHTDVKDLVLEFIGNTENPIWLGEIRFDTFVSEESL